MNGQALSQHVKEMLDVCEDQIAKGQQDYYDPLTDQQAFETMPLEALFQMAEQECADEAVYATMQFLKIRHLRQAMKELQGAWDTLCALVRFLVHKEATYLAFNKTPQGWNVRINWRYEAQNTHGMTALADALRKYFGVHHEG
jgi:hypothetical protein